MKSNVLANEAQCVLLLEKPYDALRVEYHPECLRIIGTDNFIKLETFSAKANTKFRVTIHVESVPDEAGNFTYDSECVSCRSKIIHDRHFYTTPIESNVDYLSCEHKWVITLDGKTICSKCKNVKLTRKASAETGEKTI